MVFMVETMRKVEMSVTRTDVEQTEGKWKIEQYSGRPETARKTLPASGRGLCDPQLNKRITTLKPTVHLSTMHNLVQKGTHAYTYMVIFRF